MQRPLKNLHDFERFIELSEEYDALDEKRSIRQWFKDKLNGAKDAVEDIKDKGEFIKQRMGLSDEKGTSQKPISSMMGLMADRMKGRVEFLSAVLEESNRKITRKLSNREGKEWDGLFWKGPLDPDNGYKAFKAEGYGKKAIENAKKMIDDAEKGDDDILKYLVQPPEQEGNSDKPYQPRSSSSEVSAKKKKEGEPKSKGIVVEAINLSKKDPPTEPKQIVWFLANSGVKNDPDTKKNRSDDEKALDALADDNPLKKGEKPKEYERRLKALLQGKKREVPDYGSDIWKKWWEERKTSILDNPMGEDDGPPKPGELEKKPRSKEKFVGIAFIISDIQLAFCPDEDNDPTHYAEVSIAVMVPDKNDPDQQPDDIITETIIGSSRREFASELRKFIEENTIRFMKRSGI